MIDNVLKSQAFKLKGRLYTLTVLHILDMEENSFRNNLDDMVSKAPRLFEHTPIVLDFSSVDADASQFKTICGILRAKGLIPIAVQGASESLQKMALASGLAIIGGSSFQDKELIEKPAESKASEKSQSKIINSPVRSGQQVVSMHGDLIILGSVSHGAELLATGNIHIYGALRGRALAGINGNKNARIFCQLLDAELVSIAGYYQLREVITPPQTPCQIYLRDMSIQIDSL